MLLPRRHLVTATRKQLRLKPSLAAQLSKRILLANMSTLHECASGLTFPTHCVAEHMPFTRAPQHRHTSTQTNVPQHSTSPGHVYLIKQHKPCSLTLTSLPQQHKTCTLVPQHRRPLATESTVQYHLRETIPSIPEEISRPNTPVSDTRLHMRFLFPTPPHSFSLPSHPHLRPPQYR